MDPNIGKHFFFFQEISTDLRIGQKVRWKKGGFFCEPLDEFRRKERVEEVLYKFRRRQWQPTPVFCLENPMDRGAWSAAVHGVVKSRTRLSD